MPSKSNYVCADCCCEMRVQKTGVLVQETMDNGEPYKIWACDVYACPRCNHEIAAGFSTRPVAEHFQPKYAELLPQVAWSF